MKHCQFYLALNLLFLSLLFLQCRKPCICELTEPFEGVKASEFGFLPTCTAAENAKALQAGLDSFKTVYVEQAGIYDIDTVIMLNSNTRIKFGKEVFIRKQRDENGNSPEYVFINRGAYSRTYNENIEITGLNLICNGLDDNHSKIQGLMGHVSFFYIRNLVIKDFTCYDLLSARFCIQIAEFENIHVENIHVEGNKDGIHLGAGKEFVIRNGTFKTFDDPIALNAHDYDISNPTVGWIENGLVENCYELQDNNSVFGFFCRILAGSWVDWFQGMKLQKSDIVVHNNRLYRVIGQPDGTEYTSYTAPAHTSGYKTVDGINWYMMQEGAIYNAGCRNIHFKNIFLEKHRSAAFSFHFDSDVWSRSYYPNSKAPVQSNFTFENIHTRSKSHALIYCKTPADKIRFINTDWTQGRIILDTLSNLNYQPTGITLHNITFYKYSSNSICNITANKGRSINLEVTDSKISMNDTSYRLPLYGDITVINSDIPWFFIP